MTAEILGFSGATTLDIPAENILSAAIDADLDAALVIGWQKDGAPYIASTTSHVGEMFLLMEVVKKQLLDNLDAK